MKKLLHRAVLVVAAATATTGFALPASSAQAQPGSTSARAGFLCPRIIAVCAFTEPNGEGRRRLIFTPEPQIDPPLRSAVNHTPSFWCFYSDNGFGGKRREVSTGETVNDFGFDARSARPGRCTWG